MRRRHLRWNLKRQDFNRLNCAMRRSQRNNEEEFQKKVANSLNTAKKKSKRIRTEKRLLNSAQRRALVTTIIAVSVTLMKQSSILND